MNKKGQLGNRRKTGIIFVVSGPSGSGKTTLRAMLLNSKGLKNKLVKSVSLTTRLPRIGERNSRDYIFITKRDFFKRLKAKKILEWTKYLGYYYATPREFVERQLEKGRSILLCLDLKGAFRIKRLYPKNTVTIFIIPPSIRSLKNRILGRCDGMKREEISRRIQIAKEELLVSGKYDYCIVNKSLGSAQKKLREIISKEILHM